MPDQPTELRKLASIAADLELDADMRIKAQGMIGRMGTHEALLALLELAANEQLAVTERDLALKQARELIRSGHR